MPAVVLSEMDRLRLERVCEMQGWEAARKALAVQCPVCRGLKVGVCSHRT